MKASSRIETVLTIAAVCGLLGFFSFGWIGLVIGGVVGALGGFYAASGKD